MHSIPNIDLQHLFEAKLQAHLITHTGLQQMSHRLTFEISEVGLLHLHMHLHRTLTQFDLLSSTILML